MFNIIVLRYILKTYDSVLLHNQTPEDKTVKLILCLDADI